MPDLKTTIVKTLAWFDIFDYPLTREELYKYLWCEGTPDVKKMAYEEFMREDMAPFSRNYYFLPGREHIIAERERKIPLLDKKMKIAKHAIRKLRWIPFVRAVFASNTVAQGTAHADSDIDVFIITKAGRLYLTRLLVTLILTLTRYRRTSTVIRNRVCLCFYATDDALNLAPIRIADPDIYLAYWIVQLLPLYDPDNYFEKIQHANAWLKNYLPHAPTASCLAHRFRVDDNTISHAVKKFFQAAWRGAYGDLLESQAKKIQQVKMKLNKFSVQNKSDTRVIISDQMLKFHENDRREEYRATWESRVKGVTRDPNKLPPRFGEVGHLSLH